MSAPRRPWRRVVVVVATLLGGPVAVHAGDGAAGVALVRADAAALSAGDLAAFVALYHPEVRVFGLPSDPHSLVGPLWEAMRGLDRLRATFEKRFAQRPLARVEVVDAIPFADLVVAAIRLHGSPPDRAPTTVLSVYRIADDRIRDLWHVAEEPAGLVRRGPAPESVLRRLMEAGNRLDLEGWLGLFDPGAHQWKRATDPDALANVPSKRAFDAASRRQAYAEAFAATPHGRAEIEHTITVGDHVASRGSFRFPDHVLHTLTIYRAVDGRLLDIWDVEQQKELVP